MCGHPGWPCPCQWVDRMSSGVCAYRVHRARNPQSRDVPEESSRWEAARAGGKEELGENAISSVCVFIRCNLFDGPIAHLYFVLFKRGTDSLKGPASSFLKL